MPDSAGKIRGISVPSVPWHDDSVRAWFEALGWEASPLSMYDEEGVEGWRWSHPDDLREFEEIGPWDGPPAVSDDMRAFMSESFHQPKPAPKPQGKP